MSWECSLSLDDYRSYIVVAMMRTGKSAVTLAFMRQTYMLEFREESTSVRAGWYPGGAEFVEFFVIMYQQFDLSISSATTE